MGKMSNSDRARIFLPFDALKGLQEALRVKEYENERIGRNDISEDLIEKISSNMINYESGMNVKIKYFTDGYYKLISGVPQIDYDNRIININDLKIAFDDVYDFEIISSLN